MLESGLVVPMFTQTVTRALSRLGLNERGADPHPRQPAEVEHRHGVRDGLRHGALKGIRPDMEFII